MSTDYNINLTDSALRKIYSLMEREENKTSILRVAVSGGGCSGFKYDFLIDQINRSLSSSDEDDDDYDDEFDDDDDDYGESRDYGGRSRFSKKSKDIVISDEDGNPILMVDDCSAKFLSNSVIDYTEGLGGSGFQIKNAFAKSRCGCGNSFSV